MAVMLGRDMARTVPKSLLHIKLNVSFLALLFFLRLVFFSRRQTDDEIGLRDGGRTRSPWPGLSYDGVFVFRLAWLCPPVVFSASKRP